MAGLSADHYKICKDGAEAVGFLESVKSLPDSPTPTRIICDLKMPQLGGLGLLAWIRTDLQLKNLPITLLSSTLGPTTIAQAEAEGVEVLAKPDDPAKIVEWVRRWASALPTTPPEESLN